MTALTNIEIIQAFAERDEIACELEELTAKIQELSKARQVLTARSEAASRTTEIHNGVALSVQDNHVSAVDYKVGKWALVYEHAQRPGTFLVQAHIRHGSDSVLPEAHTSSESALLAAKNFVTL